MAKRSERAMAAAAEKRPIMLDAYQCDMLLDLLEKVLGLPTNGRQYNFMTDQERNRARFIVVAINEAANKPL